VQNSRHSWKEARRFHAWHLKQQGWTQRQIATAPGVSEGAVSQWTKHGREGGPAALRRPPPGAPRRLTTAQFARVPALLRQSPETYGFWGELWTRGRMAAVMQVACGISYPPRHVGRLCKAVRWNPQKPARRAPSATKPRFPSGATTPERPSPEGGSPGANHLLHRRIRVLSSAQRRAFPCPGGPHPHPAGLVHPRLSLGHQCHFAEGQAVLPQPGPLPQR
jgi:transposase